VRSWKGSSLEFIYNSDSPRSGEDLLIKQDGIAKDVGCALRSAARAWSASRGFVFKTMDAQSSHCPCESGASHTVAAWGLSL